MVEKWLFDGHLSYEATLARVKSEFGLETSPASVGRYYRRRARERQMADLVEAQAMSDAVAAPELSTDSMRAAAVKLVAKTTLKPACERPDQLKELEALAKILLLSEDNDIRRGRLKLEEEHFHYEAAAAASYAKRAAFRPLDKDEHNHRHRGRDVKDKKDGGHRLSTGKIGGSSRHT